MAHTTMSPHSQPRSLSVSSRSEDSECDTSLNLPARQSSLPSSPFQTRRAAPALTPSFVVHVPDPATVKDREIASLHRELEAAYNCVQNALVKHKLIAPTEKLDLSNLAEHMETLVHLKLSSGLSRPEIEFLRHTRNDFFELQGQIVASDLTSQQYPVDVDETCMELAGVMQVLLEQLGKTTTPQGPTPVIEHRRKSIRESGVPSRSHLTKSLSETRVELKNVKAANAKLTAALSGQQRLLVEMEDGRETFIRAGIDEGIRKHARMLDKDRSRKFAALESQQVIDSPMYQDLLERFTRVNHNLMILTRRAKFHDELASLADNHVHVVAEPSLSTVATPPVRTNVSAEEMIILKRSAAGIQDDIEQNASPAKRSRPDAPTPRPI